MADKSLPPLYYISDTRSFVGVCVVWWRPDGQGYTCDLAEAGKFSRDEAAQICRGRASDVAYPCEEADRVAKLHVTQGALFSVVPMEPQP